MKQDSNFYRLLSAFFIVMYCLSASFVSAQTTVAEINFDDKAPLYGFGYAFGAYAEPGGGDQTKIDDQLTFAHAAAEGEGFAREMAELVDGIAKLKEEVGEDHPNVAAMVARMEEIKNNAWHSQVDTSALKIPVGTAYDYVGFGCGACFDLAATPLPSANADDYMVSFDARVSGTRDLTQSKFTINFVVADDAGGEADEDTNDDIVLSFRRGQDDGTDTLSLNSSYQRFSFALSELDVASGQKDELEKFELKGVVFNIQAQGNATDFGTDNDNKLFIDNLRLIKKD